MEVKIGELFLSSGSPFQARFTESRKVLLWFSRNRLTLCITSIWCPRQYVLGDLAVNYQCSACLALNKQPEI